MMAARMALVSTIYMFTADCAAIRCSSCARSDTASIDLDFIAWKKEVARNQSVSNEESREASEAWAMFTWTLLFCVLSTMVLTWKLHLEKKESASQSAPLAEGKLIDWSVIE